MRQTSSRVDVELPAPVSKRRRSRRPFRLTAATGAIALLLGAGVSFAFFTSEGSGAGSTPDGTLDAVSLATVGSPNSPLLPGGTGDVIFSVSNPNSTAVPLVGVTLNGTITPDSAHSGCTTTDSNPVVTLNVPPADLPISIPAGATKTIDLVGAANMDAAATNSCQGAIFSFPITVTVQR